MVKQKKTRRTIHGHPNSFLMAGSKLTQAAALKLEQRLKNDPFDLPCRLKLLGYYFKTCYSSNAGHRIRVMDTLESNARLFAG
jgi:hypothetical protein